MVGTPKIISEQVFTLQGVNFYILQAEPFRADPEVYSKPYTE